jgi:hypothetical protein
VVREDDAEAEPLGAGDVLLGDGEVVVVMAVKELPPLVWRTFAEERVQLSEDGTVATQMNHKTFTFTATGVELTEGKHYWEVELPSKDGSSTYIGISRPNLRPKGAYFTRNCTDGWSI